MRKIAAIVRWTSVTPADQNSPSAGGQVLLARIEAGAETRSAVAGDLFRFEPDERRSVSSEGGARILLMLAPWPGDGHYRGERVGVSTS